MARSIAEATGHPAVKAMYDALVENTSHGTHRYHVALLLELADAIAEEGGFTVEEMPGRSS